MFAHDDNLTIPDELFTSLRHHAHASVLVVGIGSAQHGDHVGWQLADLISQQNLPSVVVRHALIPLDLLDWIEEFEAIHLIDAMQGPPGEPAVRCWHWPDCADLVNRATTSHSFDLISVLKLASALGKATSSIVIWGVKNGGRYPVR